MQLTIIENLVGTDKFPRHRVKLEITETQRGFIAGSSFQ